MTSNDVHYPRPPVLEATAGFLTTGIAPDKLEVLQVLGRMLLSEYPSIEVISENEQPIGILLRSENEERVLRSSLTGHSFSQLAPYTGWEQFMAEFKRTWEAYLVVLGDVAIDRFFVRYYNELPIPVGVPLHHFFNIYPAMPVRDTLFDDVYLAVDTTVLSPPAKVQTRMAPVRLENGEVKMILDNTFTMYMRKPEILWENLKTVRDLKNSTFESQITDAMRTALLSEGSHE